MNPTDYGVYGSSQLIEANTLCLNFRFSFIKTMVLWCAIELGIPDFMINHDRPITLSELVASLHIHPSKTHCFYRLMRILVHLGFFAKHQPQGKHQPRGGEGEATYSLTLVFRLFPKETWPASTAGIDSVSINQWLALGTWFKNSDKTVLETARLRKIWDLAIHDTDLNSTFNETMAIDSRLIAAIILSDYKKAFVGVKSLVDVGGGTGTMAKALANAFPHIKCTVLDLPHVIDGLQGTKNLAFVAGDMFESIPPADTILLKWVLHCWSDEECVRILKRCKEAIPSKEEGGKVMIIEMVVEDNKKNKESTETQLYFDMLMMVMQSAKERNQMEWEELFFAAGFSEYIITPSFGERSLIELYP